jgi:hypothetical protein
LAHERWDGFWCVADERYYTRCIQLDGSEQWYRIGDESAPSPVKRNSKSTRIIPMRPRRVATPDGRLALTPDVRRTLLFVSARSGGREILVGSSRRRARLRPEGGAGGSF